MSSDTSNENLFLIGELTPCIAENKLPTKNQVLKTIFYHTRQLKKDINTSFADVYNEIKELWARADIPILVRSSCIYQMKKLYDDYRNLQKSKSKKNEEELKNDYIMKFDVLFDISSIGVLKTLKEPSNTFLLDQRSARSLDLCSFFEPLTTDPGK